MWKAVAHDGNGDGVLACDCFCWFRHEIEEAGEGVTWGELWQESEAAKLHLNIFEGDVCSHVVHDK